MGNVRFKASQVASELTCLARNSGRFLDVNASQILQEASRELLQISRSGSRAKWAIPDVSGRRIRTLVSDGEYQMDGKGAHYLVGELCWTMDIRPVANDVVEVVGNASIKVVLFALAQAQDVALLDEHDACHPRQKRLDPAIEINLDTGIHGGPGPFLHSQVKSMFSSTASAIGSEIDVPRLPSLLCVPSEVLDFLLNQLFQEAWPRHFAGYNLARSPAVWSGQRARFRGMFEEAARAIGSSSQSAWGWMRGWTPNLSN